jgi:5-methylcytosine-specific restriction enzyme A
MLVLQTPHRVGRPLRGLPAGNGRPPQTQMQMIRSLLRRCLDCPALVRGRPRCTDCQRPRDRARDRRRAARRPDLHNDAAERKRRAAVVADHRALIGDWCPGWERRLAHPSADLTADHVREVAAGGRPDGRLVVRCRSCNAARSAHLAHLAGRILSRAMARDPSPAEPPITHHADNSGPVVA